MKRDFLKNIYLFIFPPHLPVSPHTQSVHLYLFMHNAVSIAATQWTELGFPTSVSGPHKETQNVSEEVKGDLLDTRSTHAYYTQFLRDCCSIFQLLQLVRFLYDARNEHGIKPPIL